MALGAFDMGRFLLHHTEKIRTEHRLPAPGFMGKRRISPPGNTLVFKKICGHTGFIDIIE